MPSQAWKASMGSLMSSLRAEPTFSPADPALSGPSQGAPQSSRPSASQARRTSGTSGSLLDQAKVLHSLSDYTIRPVQPEVEETAEEEDAVEVPMTPEQAPGSLPEPRREPAARTPRLPRPSRPTLHRVKEETVVKNYVLRLWRKFDVEKFRN